MSFTAKLSGFLKKIKPGACTSNYSSITDHKIPITFLAIYLSQERYRMLLPGSEYLLEGR
jgi:hypothetical protein